MEKQKKWQFFLILAVVALTLYNILPTIFYYSKPLKSPITERQAEELSLAIVKRVDQLESDAKDWLSSYCNLIQAKPQSILSSRSNLILTFTKNEEASRFRKLFPRAGSLIPFVPAQLTLAPQENSSKEVIIQRRIPVRLDAKSFAFAEKGSSLYKELTIDRAAQVALSLAGPSESALALHSLDPRFLEPLAFQINSIAELSEKNKAVVPPPFKRSSPPSTRCAIKSKKIPH